MTLQSPFPGKLDKFKAAWHSFAKLVAIIRADSGVPEVDTSDKQAS